jgi:hypothetical protein
MGLGRCHFTSAIADDCGLWVVADCGLWVVADCGFVVGTELIKTEKAAGCRLQAKIVKIDE